MKRLSRYGVLNFEIWTNWSIGPRLLKHAIHITWYIFCFFLITNWQTSCNCLVGHGTNIFFFSSIGSFDFVVSLNGVDFELVCAFQIVPQFAVSVGGPKWNLKTDPNWPEILDLAPKILPNCLFGWVWILKSRFNSNYDLHNLFDHT